MGRLGPRDQQACKLDDCKSYLHERIRAGPATMDPRHTTARPSPLPKHAATRWAEIFTNQILTPFL